VYTLDSYRQGLADQHDHTLEKLWRVLDNVGHCGIAKVVNVDTPAYCQIVVMGQKIGERHDTELQYGVGTEKFRIVERRSNDCRHWSAWIVWSGDGK
jgi:hypothetical protein